MIHVTKSPDAPCISFVFSACNTFFFGMYFASVYAEIHNAEFLLSPWKRT